MATFGFYYVKTLRKEMKVLEEGGEMFATYVEVARRNNRGILQMAV